MDHPRGHGPLQHAAVTFSSRFNKGHLTSLPTTSRTLTFEQCLIQLSVFIYILSVSSRAFLVVSVVFECVVAF